MARSPRTSIPKTSGQGVSRYSYQKAYDLGMRGGSAFKSADLKQPTIKDKGSGAATAARASYDKLSVPGVDTPPPKPDVSLREAKARDYAKGPASEGWLHGPQKGELKFGR